MKLGIAGQVALVTGGGRGLGAEIALALAEEGARVAVCDRDLEPAEEIAGKIRAQSGEAHAYKLDVTNPSAVDRTFADVANLWGSAHILVNNAGFSQDAPVSEMSDAQWDAVLDVCLKGTFHCCRAAVPGMKQQKYGRIVNISSRSHLGDFNKTNYAAAKAGMLGMTMAAAREWAKYGVRTNTICFGSVETPMTEVIRGEKFRDGLLAQIPMGRWAQPEEVVKTICFLLSDASEYTIGQHLSVDGGYHIST